MDAKLFGQKVKELRKDKGYTNDQLAEICEIDVGHLRQIQAGKRAPSFPLAIKLCEVLGKTPNYMFEVADPEEEELIKRINSLTPHQIEALYRILDTYISLQQEYRE